MVPSDSESLERVVWDPRIPGIVWLQGFGAQCGDLLKHLYLKDRSPGDQLETVPSCADPAQDLAASVGNSMASVGDLGAFDEG